MLHFLKIIYILLLIPFFLGADDTLSRHVLVSVPPDKYFIEQIAGDTVTVGLMVPPGVSSHTFEPTPKQVLAASKADIWFQIGETFEAKAGSSLKGFNPRLELVDLRNGLSLLHGAHTGCSHHHDSSDPHIWMSPIMDKTQAQTIAKALIQKYPEHRALYEKNLATLLSELDQLNRDLEQIFAPMKNRTIMVSHPAYGYLAREYHFEQLSLECEGKDPTPQELTRIVNEAREKKIKTIFIQEQLNPKGARLVAEMLGAKVVVLDPYSEDYPKNVREIARAFASQD